jgi:hypothetical protein
LPIIAKKAEDFCLNKKDFYEKFPTAPTAKNPLELSSTPTITGIYRCKNCWDETYLHKDDVIQLECHCSKKPKMMLVVGFDEKTCGFFCLKEGEILSENENIAFSIIGWKNNIIPYTGIYYSKIRAAQVFFEKGEAFVVLNAKSIDAQLLSNDWQLIIATNTDMNSRLNL